MILICPVKDKVQGKYRDLFNWSEMLLTSFFHAASRKEVHSLKEGCSTASQLGFSKHWCYSISVLKTFRKVFGFSELTFEPIKYKLM